MNPEENMPQIILRKPMTAALTASSLLHVCGFGTLFWIASAPLWQRTVTGPITVKIQVEEALPAPVSELVPEKPKTPEKPKPPPRTPTPAATTPASQPPPKQVVPVQGLRPEALTDSPSTVVAPIGNTLMVEDEGKRLNADQVEQMGADQSAGARLIQGSFLIPEYTQDALDTNLEGSYIVDLYIDEAGKVIDAQPRKKIGYGMDERVVQSARSARFIPRKNRQGGAIAGWTELRFTLTIP